MKTLVVVIGPTGIGKTELCLSLAQQLHSPIINADSRQIYKDLKIGTASPTEEQLERVKHYFVGMLGLEDEYSAARYETDVLTLLKELFTTHETLLLSGGSMLYVDAVCKGIDDIPTVDAETRAHLKERYEEEGLEQLRKELSVMDPEYYKQVDLNNPKRIVHALEICYMTGHTYTSYRTQTHHPRDFRIVKIGLERPREELYGRINRRVDEMIENGLIEEAKRLYPYKHLNALNTVGYKEMFQYLDGVCTLDFAKEKIKANTRKYARKQMTWYRHDSDIRWFNADKTADIINFITDLTQHSA
jgi:tRNA dimethylallyltransferase